MTTGRPLPATLAVVMAMMTGAAAHEGGSNGYAAIAVDRDTIRYSLTLWPAALPAAVAHQISRARGGTWPAAMSCWVSSATR